MKARLFLIRHGETVDNVAGLYAGVRDSALTNHGVEQARRLGEHFLRSNFMLTHVFSSPLSRAFKTAEALVLPQTVSKDGPDGRSTEIAIVTIPDLVEQDFGFYEGKPFYARSDKSTRDSDSSRERHLPKSSFIDIESKESMARRADAFLDDHLLPIFSNRWQGQHLGVAVISHGMLLAQLWRRLLLRFPKGSLSIVPEVAAARGQLILEHLGSWSNTGYLELHLERTCALQDADLGRPASTPLGERVMSSSSPKLKSNCLMKGSSSQSEADYNMKDGKPRILRGWSANIVAIDNKQHLIGLKRQRGGIGRLRHDENQQTIDGFFKRRKTE